MSQQSDKILSIGSKIRLVSLGRCGEIVEGPDRKNRYLVRFGEVLIRCAASDLKVIPQNKKKKPTTPKRTTKMVKGGSLKIDLHGLTRLAATEELERALDRALLEGRDQLEIIHGLGSGALRDLTREFCSRAKNIASYQLSSQNPGQTTAWLK